MRVLVVEDEREMAELLEKGLADEGHSIALAHGGFEGVQLAETFNFDAIVLDLMLPGIDGFEVARRLRQKRNHTPILILTARDALPDMVKGLDIGADDYLTKPFSFTEFSARLRAVSRRGPIVQGPQLKVADLVLDPATHGIFRGEREIVLTKKEYALLELLMRNAGRILTHNTIIEAVWGTDQPVDDNTLQALVKLLRHKIDRDQELKLIETVRGFGYRIRKGTST
jgi:DNA-binding response OmpR family regulator